MHLFCFRGRRRKKKPQQKSLFFSQMLSGRPADARASASFPRPSRQCCRCPPWWVCSRPRSRVVPWGPASRRGKAACMERPEAPGGTVPWGGWHSCPCQAQLQCPPVALGAYPWLCMGVHVCVCCGGRVKAGWKWGTDRSSGRLSGLCPSCLCPRHEAGLRSGRKG